MIDPTRVLDPTRLELDPEREWFIEGVERGWLRFYSLCSGHSGHDDDCDRCAVGSWGLARHNGVFAGVDGEPTNIRHVDQLTSSTDPERGSATEQFAARLGGKEVGRRNNDGTWTCECGVNCASDIALYMHRQHADTHQDHT